MKWKRTHLGDDGYTSFGSSRVWKGGLEIELLGSIDELIAVLGVAKCYLPKEMSDMVTELQKLLMKLCTALISRDFGWVTESIKVIESQIEDLWRSMSLNFEFDVPGPPKANAYLHLSRAICRRVERCAWRCVAEGILPREAAVLLNRVSDLLYSMAIAVRKRG